MPVENNSEKLEHKFIKKELPTVSVSEEKSTSVKSKEKKKAKKSRLKFFNKKIDQDKKKIDEKLLEIYENADGSMPDMTHFEKEKKGRFFRSLLVLMFSCMFLGAVAWAGFFVIQPNSKFSEEDVVLSISGEEKVKIGEDVRYRIRYRNSQNVQLSDVFLQIRYPEGFVLTDSSRTPANEAKDEWLVGNLSAQESGYIDIFGKMYNSVGEKQSFRIFLNYKAENFSSEFQKVSSLTLETVEAPIGLVVENPNEAVLGSEVQFVISLDKKLEEGVGNLAIEIDGGTIFSIKSSEPKADQFVKNRWNIISNDPEQKYTIKGVFNPDLIDKSGNVNIKLVGWKNEDRSSEGFVYASYLKTINFLQNEVSTNLVINGAAGNLNVQPGESLNGTVSLKNVGNAPLKNVTARVILDAPSFEKKSILDWAAMENPQDADIVGEQLSAEKRRGTFIWSKIQIPDLRQVDPNEEIIADFGLPIKDAESTDLDVYSLSEITAALEVRYDLNGENKIISSAPIVMKINSDTDFEVQDEISLDNNKEVHVMKWVITNTFHELSNIKVEGNIYGDVIWLEDKLNVPAGKIDYDKENKKLVWTIDKMPTALDVLALQFAVILNSHNPTQTNLTSKAAFSATDTITEEQILKVGKEITFVQAE